MFRRLFSGKKTEPPAITTPAPLARAVQESILGTIGIRAIPPMPGAAQKAFRLSTDPNAEAQDFIEVIESDEGLAARVIKIANSVFFDRGKRSETIEEAVLVIGVNELRSLLNATTLSEVFPSSNPARQQIWAHDLAVAIVAKSLASRVLPGKEDLAFMAGLMHDIGKLLLVQRIGDLYQKVIQKVSEQGCSFCEAEESLFPFVHTEVGQMVGQQWNFSDELILAIRHHHDPLAGPSPATLIAAADTIAHTLAIGHPRGMSRFQKTMEANLPAALENIRLQVSDLPGFLQEMRKNIENDFELFSSQPSI